MSNNNNNPITSNSDSSNSNGTILNELGNPLPASQIHHHDVQSQPAVPLMHRTVDELLSAEFPLGNVRHSPGLNSGQGNIMEELDDLFSDDFPTVSASHSGMTHITSQAQPMVSNIHFGSPQQQQQQQQLHSHNRILQQGTTALEGTSTVPVTQTSGLVTTPALPQIQQNRMQQQQLSAATTMSQTFQPSISLPLQQQPPSSQQQVGGPPRIALPNVQMPSTTAAQGQSRPAVPTPQPTTAGVSRPATTITTTTATTAPASVVTPATAAPSIPIAQAGSPLHHILTLTTPATGAQLSNLFHLLQTNAVTPSEFLARAQRLLDPAHFEILDGIRRKHGAGARQQSADGTQTQSPYSSSPPGSSPGTPSSGPGMSSQQSLAPTTTSAITPGPTRMATVTPGLVNGTPIPASSSSSTPMSMTPTMTSNSQSAPVRKRNVETTSVAVTPADSKLASKRVKTEQPIVPGGVGMNGPTVVALPAAPSMPPSFSTTSGPATPGGGGVFKGFSLPGQQAKLSVLPSTPGMASGSSVGVGAGVGTPSSGAGGAGAGAGAKAGGAAGTEKVNYENITDVMGYVAMDLREETDNILRENDGYSRGSGGVDGQDRTRVQNFVKLDLLKATVERIASSHKLQSIDPDVLAYLAMAAQERLRGLTEQMIQASKHRGQTLATAVPPTYDGEHAMYKIGVSQDVKKQLLAIERVEREEETKRKEQIAERERRIAAGEDLDENGEPRVGGAGSGVGGVGGAGGAGAKKGKKQKEGGPGVSARNMSEEARKKVANQTALGFVGGTGRSYSWMMGGGGAGGSGGAGPASPLPSSTATPAAAASPGVTAAGSPSASGSGGVSTGGASTSKPSLARSSTMTGASAMTGTMSANGAGAVTPGIAGVSGGSGAITPSLARGASAGGGSMILPPSTLGRPTGLKDSSRKVNVRDALFCLERDSGGGAGQGSGQRVLVKSYVKWLK
ncbi:hypothetical protein BGX28_004018 [Mortierella sp. GBA30]|nr:hypothetical protein BGX28_004018 [Mortierella sp. GBA30]